MNAPPTPPKPQRSDARRNEKNLLEAAAAAFVAQGVQAPVRDIATRAGVGTGTIYRHFPTRGDLVKAVYRHQVEACAAAGPTLLAEAPTPYEALSRWTDLFVDFLITKHGLPAALGPNNPEFETLHTYFLTTLLPVCATLLEAATAAHQIHPTTTPYALMRAIGNLCIDASDPQYDARHLVQVLVAGLRPIE